MWKWRTRRSLSGPRPAAQSYLQIDRIVAGRPRHAAPRPCIPAMAFFPEREAFAAALAKAGIAFIGPNCRAIAAMGDKIESKKLAKAAGVSTVPGFMGEIQRRGACPRDRARRSAIR